MQAASPLKHSLHWNIQRFFARPESPLLPVEEDPLLPPEPDDECAGDGLDEELFFLTDSFPPLLRDSREGVSGFLTVRSGAETLSVLFLGSDSLLLVSGSLVLVSVSLLHDMVGCS